MVWTFCVRLWQKFIPLLVAIRLENGSGPASTRGIRRLWIKLPSILLFCCFHFLLFFAIFADRQPDPSELYKRTFCLSDHVSALRISDWQCQIPQNRHVSWRAFHVVCVEFLPSSYPIVNAWWMPVACFRNSVVRQNQFFLSAIFCTCTAAVLQLHALFNFQVHMNVKLLIEHSFWDALCPSPLL